MSGANLALGEAQQVTSEAPLAAAGQNTGAKAQDGAAKALPDSPGAQRYPDAIPIAAPSTDVHIETAADGTQTQKGGVYTLDRGVTITYGERVLQADHMEYDNATGDVTLTGHVAITLGETDEEIEASHGTFNIRSQTGTFYDVSGSVGAKRKQPAAGAANVTQRLVYANGNPFRFTGRMVVKTGPLEYRIFDGVVTSCQLPHPDWVLSGAEFSVTGSKAFAKNSIFRLLGLPLLWLPYVTHPVNTNDRQSGIYIPTIGFNSAAYGTTIGEQVYWAINRSTDLTAGITYYSARGYEEKGGFRYRGFGQDKVLSYFSSLQDRGYTPPGGTYFNQSGTDVTFSGRHDLIAAELPSNLATAADASGNAAPAQLGPVQERAVADVEYLSSFPYREAFSPNFNQAVSTDVVSTIYFTREANGMAGALEGDRYQGEKRVEATNAVTGVVTPEEQVHIFHAPALEFATTDHLLGVTGLEWNFSSSAAALKRTQPNFETSGMIERLDLRPEIAYPFGFDGWRIRPSIGGRETFYSRSRYPSLLGGGGAPVENTATLNRSDVDIQLDIRPPVLERTFDSGFLRRLLGQDFKHTIQPEIHYRYVSGIDNFPDVLRFDGVDIASNTNEIEYGITQRFYLRPKETKPCRVPGEFADVNEIFEATGRDNELDGDAGEASGRGEPAQAVCGSREWVSWRVAQKYFFDQTFGGAVASNGPRDILGTTLDFSGISFLTGPRNISPIVSRLRVRTSEKTDIEWDFDYDTCSSNVTASTNRTLPCQSKFTANNIYLDLHQGSLNTGLTYARLNAPARSYVNGSLSAVADYEQMRVHAGFRSPSRPGFSVAATAGIDIDLGTVQYGSIVTAYNWNCCGLVVEYRKQQLGTTPPKDGYGFNFTLVNIGSVGNVRHADQVF